MNSNWMFDEKLKSRLKELVKNSYKQNEILAVVTAEFGHYMWSLRTLQRRLQFFNIQRNDNTVDPNILLEAVKVETCGPGHLLGYRALHRKIRNEHNLFVKRQDVYLAMNVVCPEKLEERKLTENRKKFHKRVFKSKGPNWLWSMDGHDKLMGKNKSEFPLGVHGCIDSFSRKILWLKIWPSNSNPNLPAKLFFDAIVEHGYMPCLTRSDRGSENVLVATMHNFLKRSTTGRPCYIFGSSVTNQAIEQWWRGFRERHGEFFKTHTHTLVCDGYYDENRSTCRVLLAYVLIPLIQNEMDSFKDNWNRHRIRKQNIYRPCGVPNFLYDFPQDNGGLQCGERPEICKIKFVQQKIEAMGNLNFISNDLDKEFQIVLRENNLIPLRVNNAKNAYFALFDSFKLRSLQFTFD